MKYNLKKLISLLVFAFAVLCAIKPIDVFAAEGKVYFGSERYETKAGEAFKVGVYLEGSEDIGDYMVQIAYDQDFYKYVGGADSEENGIITLKGNRHSNAFRYMIDFKAVADGTTTIRVKQATLLPNVGEEGTSAMIIDNLPVAPIQIAAAKKFAVDSVTINGVDVELDAEKKSGKVEIPYADAIEIKAGAGINIEASKDSIEPGKTDLELKFTNSDKQSVTYNIEVTMAEKPSEEVTAVTPNSQPVVDTPQQNAEPQHDVQADIEKVHEADIKRRNRNNVLLASILLILVVIAFIVILVSNLNIIIREKKADREDLYNDDEPANSDFSYFALDEEVHFDEEPRDVKKTTQADDLTEIEKKLVKELANEIDKEIEIINL